jgi:hypothetical protein
MHFAESGAQIALYPAIFQCMPVAGFYSIGSNKVSQYFSPGYANKPKASFSHMVLGKTFNLFLSSMTYQRNKINDFYSLTY